MIVTNLKPGYLIKTEKETQTKNKEYVKFQMWF